jgi:polar amino acid transport system substrate-binding protein
LINKKKRVPFLLWILIFYCSGWLIKTIIGFFSSPSKLDYSLKVGISLDYPPFAYYKNNEPSGLEVALSKIIAKKLGRDLIIKDVSFESLIASVSLPKSKKFDFCLAAITQTDERSKVVDFSIPYHTSYSVLIVKKSHPQLSKIKKIAKNSMFFSNLRIGVQAGTSYETYLNEQSKDTKITIMALPKVCDLIQALYNDQIDMFMLGNHEGSNLIKKIQNLILIGLDNTKVSYAIAFPKHSAWRPKINKILQSMKNDGNLKKLEETYRIS